MKASRKKPSFVVPLATVFILFALFFLLNEGRDAMQSPASVVDPVSEMKSKILEVASSEKPFTTDDREMLFNALSGPKMLQYSFTNEEKQLIVKALNAVNSMTMPVKQKSSAKENFSGVLRESVSSRIIITV